MPAAEEKPPASERRATAHAVSRRSRLERVGPTRFDGAWRGLRFGRLFDAPTEGRATRETVTLYCNPSVRRITWKRGLARTGSYRDTPNGWAVKNGA